MKLHNTLSREVEEIKPLNSPEVTVYTCGPTVYDYPHIGNWFTFIRYDVLVRALRAGGFKPKWVMNITDVGHLVSDEDEGEDKLEVGAKREGKTAWAIAEKYTEYFKKGLKRLNFLQPNYLERATDHIEEQIDLVKKLEVKGLTYTIDDGVYYDTSKFPKYGELAKLDLENLKAGARVTLNPQKKNPTDFALWKFSPKAGNRDMEWGSPWGKGFPGWHLECSAIAMKYLGETIDIHAGGIDHIPTHHTNEIAQSEGATGKKFVNCWMHGNFALVDGKKMAKSAGTFITLEDIEKKGFSPEAFRLLVLESHYRTEAHFSWQNLEAAQNRLKSIQNWADLRFQPLDVHLTKELKSQAVNLQNTNNLIVDMAADDLNSPGVLFAINDLMNKMNYVYEENLGQFNKMLILLEDLLGLSLMNSKDISADLKELIKKSDEFRLKYQKYAESDKIRSELESKHHIGLRQTTLGPVWFRL